MRVLCLIAVMCALATTGRAQSQSPGQAARLDKQVQAFLERHRGTWQDVPESDGRVLHRLIPECWHGFPQVWEGAPESFLAHLKTVPDGVTTIDTSSSQGISITCKR